MEQHRKWQKDEADMVQKDKNDQDPRTGGLFKGCFSHRTPRFLPMRDQEDGVERCPLCSWELEDGECARCGLFMDEDGQLTFGDGFTGFSEMDEEEELDADMDMDEEFDGYGFSDAFGPDERMAALMGTMGDEEQSFALRRFLGAGGGYHQDRRRRISHSEAGSRRSYSQSIVSDMYTDEMDTVEEEDEEGLDEDSSMNDFIDDVEGGSSTSQSAPSSQEQTPQPARSNRSRVQGRARRVVESEASSEASNIAEEDEDDEEEDEGPIRRGTRNRAQARRILGRANGSRGPSSTAGTEVSADQNLDDLERQALLQADGWMRHDDLDEEMGEEDDDDDESDGGRTTVGWDATAISNDRLRMGGSLTPTADRPRPSPAIRPPSRVGNGRFLDGSRGLRRRSSTLSTSTAHYEDGEADDDDSDLNGDVDVERAMNTLRERRSRAQMRPSNAFRSPNSRFANQRPSQINAIDLDTDDNSDNNEYYDPRISHLFAEHQRVLQESLRGGAFMEQEHRSTTPIARPRTGNRNRTSPAAVYSPFMPPGNAPGRLRTPLMNVSSNTEFAQRSPNSPHTRPNGISSVPVTSGPDIIGRIDRITSNATGGGGASLIQTPASPARGASQPTVNAISQMQTTAAMDMIDRPPSRVGARTPLGAIRRTPSSFSPVFSGLGHTSVGLNMGNRVFPPHSGNNPWAAFVRQPNGVRSRSSRSHLREQSSTATLRATNSRVNLRDTGTTAPGVRNQASRINLRHQPSHRRLSAQASNRTLRASEHARPPPSPTTHTGAPASPNNRLTQDELVRRGRELVNNRATELLGTNPPVAAPQRTNPFTSRYQRAAGSNRSDTSLAGALPASVAHSAPTHVRSSSNESLISVGSSSTTHTAPPAQGLTRRRSNRNMASAPPPGAFPASPTTFPPPHPTYPNAYLRARSGSLSGNSAFESPLNNNQRGMSPMVAAGDSSRY